MRYLVDATITLPTVYPNRPRVAIVVQPISTIPPLVILSQPNPLPFNFMEIFYLGATLHPYGDDRDRVNDNAAATILDG